MSADKTAIKKYPKKFNAHENHSRKTPVWKRREVVKCLLEPTFFCPSNEHDIHSRKTPTRKWKQLRQLVKCSLDTYGLAHGS